MPGSDSAPLSPLVGKARFRILQGTQLLHSLSGEVFAAISPSTPEACLQAADELWHLLVAQRDERPEWKEIAVDGRTAEEILRGLNDLVYDILAAELSERGP